jgi:hypothetical protein
MISAALRAVPVLVALAGVGGDGLTAGHAPNGALHPQWTEVQWPFPIDQWGTGRAFRCGPAACGATVTVYLRPKIGFCNCQTGVADDEELDRVGDMDLVGSEKSALTPGRPITVQWMKGRSRSYKVGGGSAKSALSLAFNDKCDVIVATVIAGNQPAAQEEAVLEFLNGDVVRNWAEQVLGAPAERWDGRLTSGGRL